MSIKQRNIFVAHLQKLFVEKGIRLSADEYFLKQYKHKLRGGEKISKVIGYWL